MTTEIWLFIIAALFGIIAFFLKRIMDNTDRVARDVNDMRPKVELLWTEVFSTAHSPRQLNQRGEDILDQSGIKQIVDAQKMKLTKVVKSFQLKNPYEAEKVIMDVMTDFPKHCPEYVEALQQGAFQTGVTVDVVLYVGGLYLRNLIFGELGFSLTDLDKPIT